MNNFDSNLDLDARPLIEANNNLLKQYHSTLSSSIVSHG